MFETLQNDFIYWWSNDEENGIGNANCTQCASPVTMRHIRNVLALKTSDRSMSETGLGR